MVKFTEEAKEQYLFFLKFFPKIAKKIDALVDDMKQHPKTGLGKPEALKYEYTGFWSRRVTSEHRLVYRIEGEEVIVYSCRYHY